MRKMSLMRKSLTLFIICVAVLLLLATPLFYWLTKNFYAEDMLDIIEAVRNGRNIPKIDLEQDIMQGVMLQFGLITAILGIAIVLMIRFISRRLWLPFDHTLHMIESFNLEKDIAPRLEESNIKEFDRMNIALTKMMNGSLHSYRLQREFTENASHELQTPLAVFQSKLDLLMQQPELTGNQAVVIQDLYQMNNRLSRLSRNLLLLAKMENGQFETTEQVDVISLINELMPYLETLADGLDIRKHFDSSTLSIRANRPLLESLVNNLVVNAVRHNHPDGKIFVTVTDDSLIVANTSSGKALDGKRIFSRFYRTDQSDKGNGLGLAIVKAVCDYHGWNIYYTYNNDMHEFRVVFH